MTHHTPIPVEQLVEPGRRAPGVERDQPSGDPMPREQPSRQPGVLRRHEQAGRELATTQASLKRLDVDFIRTDHVRVDAMNRSVRRAPEEERDVVLGDRAWGALVAEILGIGAGLGQPGSAIGRRADPEDVDVVGDADPWGDLWFYTNPIFIDVIR